jgi:predicted dehydrogenase
LKVLRNTEEHGYLDQAMTEGCLRIQVVKVTQYPPLDEQFFRRQFDLRFALAYVRDIGLLNVFRKVKSRLAERVRNERYIVVGVGRVIESKDPSNVLGDLVPFIVPDSGPPSERYVVRRDLVGDPWRGDAPDNLPAMWEVVIPDTVEDDPAISKVAGWHGYSGAPWPLSKHEIEAMADRALKVNGRSKICTYSHSPVTERTETARELGLTIFGYGNYVKTVVIPNLGRRIPVRCVHEVDPWQIGRSRNEPWSWDTSPGLRPDEDPDVVVVASYHHTHASIAVEAMERGARAVIIEKPIVTIGADLEILCAAVEKCSTPVFVAFQKRYSRFNEYISGDLRIRPGEPVSCFGIAYEVPLPPQHWYRWPNSGSRIISNGCHWIDHFLYLNYFSPARQVAAVSLGEASILIRIILENEAVLSLSLTHEGSPRLGVREHCEFRANGVTATVTDAKDYVSESARGVIRKAHVHRFSAYRRMYRSMCEAIAAGTDGDSLKSLEQSGYSVLAAEAAMTDAANRLGGSFVQGFGDLLSSGPRRPGSAGESLPSIAMRT